MPFSGRPISRRQLRERLYGAREPEVLGNPVQVHIHNLRAKLGEVHATLIQTVRSVGYRFGQSRWNRDPGASESVG